METKRYIVSLTYYYEVDAECPDEAADLALEKHRADVNSAYANIDIDEMWEVNEKC